MNGGVIMNDFDTVEVFEIEGGLLLIFEFQDKIIHATMIFGYYNPSIIRERFGIPKTVPIYVNPNSEFWGGYQI